MRSRLTALLIAVALAQPALAARWRVAVSDHFRLYSQASPAAVKMLAEKLERYDAGMRFLFALPADTPPTATRLTVFVTHDVASVQRLFSRDGRGQTMGVYGFYQSFAEGSIAFAPSTGVADSPLELDGLSALLHEYAHHVMLGSYDAPFPAWYREGFADFCANVGFEADGSITFGHSARYRARGLMQRRQLSAHDLFEQAKPKLRPDELVSIYERGWLLTHYLMLGSKARAPELHRYLALIERGVPSLKAAETSFGDLGALDRELDAYRKVPLDYVTIPVAKLRTGSIRVQELSDGENEMMPVRMRSQRGVDKESARDVAHDAQRIAAGYPRDAAVQLALAEAMFDAGDDGAADKAAERAGEIAPSARALLYRSRQALRRALAKGPQPDPALLREARGYVLAANRLDPNDPLALYLYYKVATAAGPPNRNARDALERSFELEPQADEIRLAVARQMARDDDLRAVRLVLTPMALNPHASKSYAAAVLRLLDEGKEDAARKLLLHPEEDQGKQKDTDAA